MFRRTALAVVLLALTSAPAALRAADGPAPPAAAPAPEDARIAEDARSARIAELEAAVEHDHATLRRLVKLDPETSATPLHEHPVLLDIARRLPAMEAELRHLREAPPTAPPAP